MTLADHLALVPVVIPALAAPLMLLLMPRMHRLGVTISFASCALMLLAGIAMLAMAGDGAIRTYEIGNWPAPFGIVLVVDRLSAIMCTLAATLSLIALTHAVVTGTDRKGWHFHPLFQFQLMGLNGAFLTGDLFNLFVFFEVLLIASYGLVLHGQGPARLRAGVQYVVVNIMGSSLFLIALGLLYSLTGTLNMADMGLRVAQIGVEDQGLLRVAALMLASVFALKAALVPLHLWLPRTYDVTTPAVAALFALMTKVGVYSMIRVVPLIFGDGAGAAAWVPAPYLLPIAIITALIGFGGVFAARTLSEQAAYAVIGSTGTLMVAVAGWTEGSIAAALYYLVHSTLAGAALFLVSDVAARRRGSFTDVASPGPVFAQRQLSGLLFLAAAIAAAGLPPLSGFLGKLMILGSTFGLPGWGWGWAAILFGTFMGVVGFARVGSSVFWKDTASPVRPASARTPRRMPPRDFHADMAAPVAALILLACLAAAAGPVSAYMQAASAQVFDNAATVRAVLGDG